MRTWSARLGGSRFLDLVVILRFAGHGLISAREGKGAENRNFKGSPEVFGNEGRLNVVSWRVQTKTLEECN